MIKTVLWSKFFRLILVVLVGIFIMVPNVSQAIIAPGSIKPSVTGTTTPAGTTVTPKASTTAPATGVGVGGNPDWAVKNFKAAVQNIETGDCSGLFFTWAFPNSDVMATQQTDFSIENITYQIEITGGDKNISEWTQVIKYDTSYYPWKNDKLTCNQTYNLTIHTYYQKTDMASVTTTIYTASTHPTEAACGTSCNVQKLNGWVTRSSTSVGVMTSTAHLKWNLPDKDTCYKRNDMKTTDIKACAFDINGQQQPCFKPNMGFWTTIILSSPVLPPGKLDELFKHPNTTFENEIRTKTPYTVTTIIGGKSYSDCSITLDPGNGVSDYGNYDPDAPGGANTTPPASDQCDARCNHGNSIEQALCSVQCIIIGWLQTIMQWLFEHVVKPVIGLDAPANTTTTPPI